jgi:hypothetical protein
MPYRIHVLPLLNHGVWKQLIFLKKMSVYKIFCAVLYSALCG